MRIGIIGAGHIGGALTRRFRAAGHDVKVANSRGPETLTELAQETGALPVDIAEATRDVDAVVVTIPEKNVATLPEGMFGEVAPDAPVIDTGNYYPERDGRIGEIEEGLPESKWVQQQLGHPVIKAFNNIYAQHLQDMGSPAGSPGRIALPVAGDNAAAKDIVMRLIDEIGFDPVDAGSLDDSWRQQPGAPVYAQDLDSEGVRRALDEARPERPAAFRAQATPGA